MCDQKNKLAFLSLLIFFSNDLNKRRKDRENDNSKYDKGEIVFASGKSAKEITNEQKGTHPNNRTDYVIGCELSIRHGTYSSHKGCESPYNRNEAGINNRLAAVLLVKALGFL